MKKEYLKPEINIINVNVRQNLLAGSDKIYGNDFYNEETEQPYGY